MVTLYHPDLKPLKGEKGKNREITVTEGQAKALCADPPKGGGWKVKPESKES